MTALQRAILIQLKPGAKGIWFDVEWQGTTRFCLRWMESGLVEELALGNPGLDQHWEQHPQANRRRLLLNHWSGHDALPRDIGVSIVDRANAGVALRHIVRPRIVHGRRWSARLMPHSPPL